MASTLTTIDGIAKERYGNPDIVEKLIYPDNVLLGMLLKKGDTGMVGDAYPIPLITTLPQGQAGVFSTAQTNANNVGTAKWNTTAGDYYGVVAIGDKALMASRTNPGAFLEDKKLEIDSLYEQTGENLSLYAWGNGGGSIGQRSSAATNDITLTNPEETANFEIGMTVSASANDGSATTDTQRAGTTTVTAVNRATGVITLASAAAITSFADSDYLFRSGDFFGDQGTVILKGVQAYITATDTPAALWGITAATRLTDPQRYAGCRVTSADIAGKSFEERIKILLARMSSRYKAKMPTAGFMNPEDFATLDTLMATKGQRALSDETTKFGYSKIDVLATGGRVPIYPDRHCPKGTFFALRMDNWWVTSMGEFIHPQNEDGFDMLRKSTTTDYEFRLISYPILACNAPKNNGRVPLT
ncbi:MAG: hypothetical protein EPO32_14935 [Anaerolineae bacterium]|nr:MAG: hypothetical protein EPO32_14935 [Anaerolineae bacterium]